MEESASTGRLMGVRKAAIVMAILGEDLASEVFKRLDDQEIQVISRALFELQEVTPEQAENVMEDFHRLSLARSYVTGGGADYAQKLLTKTFGAEQAKRLLDRVALSTDASSGFDRLGKCDPQQLSKLLQSENPQTIALIIAHLDPKVAAETFSQLPEEAQTEVAIRMASLQDVSQDVVRRVSAVLGQKISSLDSSARRYIGGVRAVAELFNYLDRTQGRKILDELGESNPDLALAVRNLMITFDDLLLVDNLGIREIIARVDKKVLALALKGTSPELQERFYSNMSQRAAEMVREEIEYMGAVKLKDVSKAQQEVIDILRTLDEEGVISLSGGGEEQYVS